MKYRTAIAGRKDTTLKFVTYISLLGTIGLCISRDIDNYTTDWIKWYEV